MSAHAEVTCPRCRGNGELGGQTCERCEGLCVVQRLALSPDEEFALLCAEAQQAQDLEDEQDRNARELAMQHRVDEHLDRVRGIDQ